MKLTPAAAIEWLAKNTLRANESLAVLLTKDQHDEVSGALHKATLNGKYLGRGALKLANPELVALFGAFAKGDYTLTLTENLDLVDSDASAWFIRTMARSSRKTAQDAPNGPERGGNPSGARKASLQRHCNANSAGRASRRVPVSSFARR
jgi:hypothetical protein